MKNMFSLACTILVLVSLTACETIQGPDGRQRTVVSPEGMALMEVGLSAAIGAGTGALMQKSPGWANGAVSGAAGNVGSQLLRAFVPTANQVYRQQAQPVPYPVYPRSNPVYQAYPVPPQPTIPQNYRQQDAAYLTASAPTANMPIYERLPDGTYVRIQ